MVESVVEDGSSQNEVIVARFVRDVSDHGRVLKSSLVVGSNPPPHKAKNICWVILPDPKLRVFCMESDS